MPAVGLALGGGLRKRRPGAGADPPLPAGCREAGEVAVLQTLLSSRARRLVATLVWRGKPAGATTAQHLESFADFRHFLFARSKEQPWASSKDLFLFSALGWPPGSGTDHWRGPHLGTVHFAVSTSAAVALFLPAAAVGKLEPSVAAASSNTYDCSEKETVTFRELEMKPAAERSRSERRRIYTLGIWLRFYRGDRRSGNR